MTESARPGVDQQSVFSLIARLGLWTALFDERAHLLDATTDLVAALRTAAPALPNALRRTVTAALHDGALAHNEDVALASGPRFRVRAVRTRGDLHGLPRGALAVVERLPDDRSDTSEWACYHFTPRERDVARLVARGLAADRIALTLSVSRHTARRHIERIEAKLSVHSRAEAAVKLLRAPRAAGASA